MFKFSGRQAQAAVAATALLAGCATTGASAPGSDANTTEVGAVYSWTLPKTVLEISATWTFQGCEATTTDKLTMPKADVKIVITPSAVPDRHLGPAAPNGWVSLDVAKLQSFWQDSQFEVKTFPNTHLLQSISSTSVNQAGTILSNVLTTVVKGVGLAVGLPTAGEPSLAPVGCDMSADGAQTKWSALKAAQAKLKGIDPASAEGKALTANIVALQSQLSFTVVHTVDPGNVDTQDQPIDELGKIGVFAPTSEQLAKEKWLESTMLNRIYASQEVPNPFYLSVYLDFAASISARGNRCSEAGAGCTHAVTPLPEGALFRDVAYIPVEVYLGPNKIIPASPKPTILKPIQRGTFPFAQFGTARSLPLKAPWFGKAAWAFTFSDSGEINDATWGSTARGVGWTSALSAVVGADSSVAAERIKASAQLDGPTQAQQVLNSKLQVWLTAATLQQQCQAALAKGQVPQCD